MCVCVCVCVCIVRGFEEEVSLENVHSVFVLSDGKSAVFNLLLRGCRTLVC